MHKIISTTGAPIEFTLTAEKNFVIDPVNPIEVSDEELASLQERLGSQISEVSDEEKSEPTAEEIAAKEQADKEATDAEAAAKADPILKNYKVLDEAGVIAPDGSTVAKDGVVELDSLDENTISLLTAGTIEEEIPQA